MFCGLVQFQQGTADIDKEILVDIDREILVDIDREILKCAQKGPIIISSLEKEGRKSHLHCPQCLPRVSSADFDSARSGAHSGSIIASPVGGTAQPAA